MLTDLNEKLNRLQKELLLKEFENKKRSVDHLEIEILNRFRDVSNFSNNRKRVRPFKLFIHS